MVFIASVSVYLTVRTNAFQVRKLGLILKSTFGSIVDSREAGGEGGAAKTDEAKRKGRMTPTQRWRRTELERQFGRPDPKAVELSTVALLKPFLSEDELELHSDDHPAYRRALRRLRNSGRVIPRIEHRITSSRLRRTCSNPLFPVNLTDLLLRHGGANHHRETIAYSKRRQATMERVAIFSVWRDYVKKRRENGPQESAGMWLGLVDRLLSWREILRRRLFPAHTSLPEVWNAYYWRRVKTVVLGNRQTTHRCRYAF